MFLNRSGFTNDTANQSWPKFAQIDQHTILKNSLATKKFLVCLSRSSSFSTFNREHSIDFGQWWFASQNEIICCQKKLNWLRTKIFAALMRFSAAAKRLFADRMRFFADNQKIFAVRKENLLVFSRCVFRAKNVIYLMPKKKQLSLEKVIFADKNRFFEYQKILSRVGPSWPIFGGITHCYDAGWMRVCACVQQSTGAERWSKGLLMGISTFIFRSFKVTEITAWATLVPLTHVLRPIVVGMVVVILFASARIVIVVCDVPTHSIYCGCSYAYVAYVHEHSSAMDIPVHLTKVSNIFLGNKSEKNLGFMII